MAWNVLGSPDGGSGGWPNVLARHPTRCCLGRFGEPSWPFADARNAFPECLASFWHRHGGVQYKYAECDLAYEVGTLLILAANAT